MRSPIFPPRRLLCSLSHPIFSPDPRLFCCGRYSSSWRPEEKVPDEIVGSWGCGECVCGGGGSGCFLSMFPRLLVTLREPNPPHPPHPTRWAHLRIPPPPRKTKKTKKTHTQQGHSLIASGAQTTKRGGRARAKAQLSYVREPNFLGAASSARCDRLPRQKTAISVSSSAPLFHGRAALRLFLFFLCSTV